MFSKYIDFDSFSSFSTEKANRGMSGPYSTHTLYYTNLDTVVAENSSLLSIVLVSTPTTVTHHPVHVFAVFSREQNKLSKCFL